MKMSDEIFKLPYFGQISIALNVRNMIITREVINSFVWSWFCAPKMSQKMVKLGMKIGSIVAKIRKENF